VRKENVEIQFTVGEKGRKTGGRRKEGDFKSGEGGGLRGMWRPPTATVF